MKYQAKLHTRPDDEVVGYVEVEGRYHQEDHHPIGDWLPPDVVVHEGRVYRLGYVDSECGIAPWIARRDVPGMHGEQDVAYYVEAVVAGKWMDVDRAKAAAIEADGVAVAKGWADILTPAAAPLGIRVVSVATTLTPGWLTVNVMADASELESAVIRLRDALGPVAEAMEALPPGIRKDAELVVRVDGTTWAVGEGTTLADMIEDVERGTFEPLGGPPSHATVAPKEAHDAKAEARRPASPQAEDRLCGEPEQARKADGHEDEQPEAPQVRRVLTGQAPLAEMLGELHELLADDQDEIAARIEEMG